LPKVEPRQVKRVVPPQVPSVEMAVGVAIALELVAVALSVSLPQRPNAAWQPVEQ